MSKSDNSRAKNRPQRVPLHRTKLMNADKIPGKVSRWVNDSHGRIEKFRAAGYDFVNPEEVNLDPTAQDTKGEKSVLSKVVDRATGLKAYLMAIDEEFYKEDQLEKQQKIDENEAKLGLTEQQKLGNSYGSIQINKG